MKISFFALAMLLLVSCASNNSSSIQKIYFGTGGGVTGNVTSYTISPDGNLSRIQRNDTTFLKTIPQDQLEEAFESVENIREVKFSVPDNVYRFITIEFKDVETRRWVWGIGNQDVPKDIISLYNNLTKLTK